MRSQVFFCYAALSFLLCTTNGLDTEIRSVIDFGQDVLFRQGYCQWEMASWHKIGETQKCNCMKCTCAEKGEWNCKYSFADCPYSYCNKDAYNIREKKCCCTSNFGKRSLGIGARLEDGIVATKLCFLLPIDETKHAIAPFENCPEVKQTY
ncbi:uncharacterized protein LOC114538176 [Dendronephthya gigantea]|uniref:uncharacterized protein LOC114538176 n=1 Tax=Dendronephthya gigantea TaxID=151771 RepID=UPI00106D66D5|nr:uncharacterized protein LOC114538176 [Dendronephthya gigantea]